MESSLKKILRALSLELRHTLEGWYDSQGVFRPGDLERRLNELGVWRERPSRPLEELPHLTPEDKAARQVIDAYIAYRLEAKVSRSEAIAEFVRESAYTWANRLLALRCMEARGIIDEVILQKEAYGGRSLTHHRLARRNPEACAGLDEGLFAVLFAEFETRSAELPELFDPHATAVVLRPSLSALKRCIALLSGTESLGSQEPASDKVFAAPDALGWAYQYWNTEEKDRVFEKVRTQKAKIEGADIIPATQLYTEPYMVRFLVQNSLGALWMGMYPKSNLAEGWEYYVKDADRALVEPKPVSEISFLDPAAGSGHFLLEAFDLFVQMNQEESKFQRTGETLTPEKIAASILNHNFFAIDIDGRAIQIAIASLWMKAKEYAPDLQAGNLTSFHDHLVATDIRLPKGKDHLKAFLEKHPEARPLRLALETIFEGLQNVHELGSLVQIEEPVEKELHYLKEQYDAARGKPEQMVLFAEMKKSRQGELPLGVESYEQWKIHTLADLEQHFFEEAEAADRSQAFFGHSARQGLALFDLLARRYDVVAANPPYMGSKNIGSYVKDYIFRRYALGKYDLYATFILRCLSLSKRNGRVAMVTQNSWMYLKSYANLRLSDPTEKTTVPEFKGILKSTTIEMLAHLGPGSFSEIGGEVVKSVLFILNNSSCPDQHRITTFHLNGFIDGTAKAQALSHLSHATSDLRHTPLQSLFERLPDSPLIYHVSDEIAHILINSTHLGEKAQVKPGPQTSDNTRFTRYFWECNHKNDRWFQLSKGGGFKRWVGLNNFVIDWEYDGIRIKEYNERNGDHWSRNVRNVEHLFKNGVSYSAFGNFFSARLLSSREICDTKGPGIYIEPDQRFPLLGFLNTHFTQYLLKLLSPALDFNPRTICALPLPSTFPTTEIIAFVIKLKSILVSTDITEFSFEPTFSMKYELNLIAAFLHSMEGIIEQIIIDNFDISRKGLEDIVLQTGRFEGESFLLTNYNSIPSTPEASWEIPGEITSFIKTNDKCTLSPAKLTNLRHHLQALYVAGPSGKVDDIDSEPVENNDDEDTSGAHIPIPAETFLEELSQKLQIHPISVYWLLKEGIEQEGWRCLPEEKRITEDHLTVLILRLLGHRWPKQIEAGEPVPDWADADGIIPLTPAFGEQTLPEQVRARIPSEFPDGSIASIERAFEEIVGEPLDRWLSGSFFKHHVSQFKKRPIAWQLSSTSANGKKKKGVSKAPAFSCLVYYHRLDADLLPKLRTQYVGPLRQRYETELRTLDGIAFLSPDQAERRIQLGVWIDELRDFEARLEAVAQGSFASPDLEKLLSAEPLDAWTSHDGRAPSPEYREAFLLQEQRYDPDLNDGVRVNISPLQKAGLLAADVLDAKDLDKAIADRAAWRADERRWCRVGKLPKPGWWN